MLLDSYHPVRQNRTREIRKAQSETQLGKLDLQEAAPPLH